MGSPITRRSALVGAVASATALTFGTASSAAAAPSLHEVRIKGFAFEPRRLQARIGDTIRWTNDDLAPHTATADAFGWDTEEIAQGVSAELIVTQGMETGYFCAFHPHMTGSLEILQS